VRTSLRASREFVLGQRQFVGATALRWTALFLLTVFVSAQGAYLAASPFTQKGRKITCDGAARVVRRGDPRVLLTFVIGNSSASRPRFSDSRFTEPVARLVFASPTDLDFTVQVSAEVDKLPDQFVVSSEASEIQHSSLRLLTVVGTERDGSDGTISDAEFSRYDESQPWRTSSSYLEQSTLEISGSRLLFPYVRARGTILALLAPESGASPLPTDFPLATLAIECPPWAAVALHEEAEEPQESVLGQTYALEVEAMLSTAARAEVLSSLLFWGIVAISLVEAASRRSDGLALLALLGTLALLREQYLSQYQSGWQVLSVALALEAAVLIWRAAFVARVRER
jgi:hypothetical protein